MSVLNGLIERATHNSNQHIDEDDIANECCEEENGPARVYVLTIEKINTVKLTKTNKPLVNQRA